MQQKTPFLKQVAERYRDEIIKDSRKLCFVFPNRRAMVFFRRYVSELAVRPLFSPVLTTIDELFAQMSELRQADRITLLVKLYECYTPLARNPESFDEFIFWGDMLLADFNDADKYLVNVDNLFMNIADLNALHDDFSYLDERQREAIRRFWGSYFTDEAEAGKGKSVFKSNWELLLPLYHSFNEKLADEGIGYAGMVYRKVAEDILSRKNDAFTQYGTVVFVGLNALNECEKVLLRHFRDTGKGDFYWDFQGGLLDSGGNIGAMFVRQNMRDFPSKRPLDDMPDCPERLKVEVFSIPSAVGQAKCAAEILSSLGDGVGRETAVVLPDVSLLEPMLYSIPENINAVNVTMGFPMNASPLMSFMASLKMLHVQQRESAGKKRFYHRSVMELLRHRFLSFIPEASSIADTILSGNLIYVEPELFAGNPLLETVFRPVVSSMDDTRDTDGLAAYQIEVLEEVGRSAGNTDREFIKKYLSAIVRLRDMRLPVKPSTWFKLVDAIVSGISVPFNGEPLSGLQVMGPLETRGLDFENIIFTSMNEGLFPSQNVSSSFIPYVLRKGFGLPTYEFQEAIWAYYFYRLLYRAKRVFLITDTRVENLKGAGESRYIKQLEYLYSDKIDFVRRTVAFSSSVPEPRPPKSVQKDSTVMKILEDCFLSGKKKFSASSLNDYLSCPLKFYFAHVSEERPEQELADDVDAGTFGSWFHKAMMLLYSPFNGKEVGASAFDAMLSDGKMLEKVVTDAFFEEVKGAYEIKGANLVNKEVILRIVNRTLETDKGFAPLKFVALEMPLDSPLDLDDGRRVFLKGVVDRMDVREGCLRIVDYKTGKVELSKDVEKVFDKDILERPKVLLQLFIYQYLVSNSRKSPSSAVPLPKQNVVYSIREIFSRMPSEFVFSDESYLLMEEGVKNTVQEILDPDVPFVQGSHAPCKYCDFYSVCKKTV